MTDHQFSAEWCRAAAGCIAELEQRLAAAESAKEDAIADARAQFDKYMDCHKAYRELQDKLSAAEARVGELTNQLALRLRAESCDKEELLAECIENRQRLAAAEAAARWWRMAARGYILAEGELHPDERWPWLVDEAADEAAKGGGDVA